MNRLATILDLTETVEKMTPEQLRSFLVRTLKSVPDLDLAQIEEELRNGEIS